jgi:hypothetical protein
MRKNRARGKPARKPKARPGAKPGRTQKRKGRNPGISGRKPRASRTKKRSKLPPYLTPSGQRAPPVPSQQPGERPELWIQRVYERELLVRGTDPTLQKLMVRLNRADGATANYTVSSYLTFVERKRYGRKPRKGLTLEIGYDLGPGKFWSLRRGREVPVPLRKPERVASKRHGSRVPLPKTKMRKMRKGPKRTHKRIVQRVQTKRRNGRKVRKLRR